MMSRDTVLIIITSVSIPVLLIGTVIFIVNGVRYISHRKSNTIRDLKKINRDNMIFACLAVLYLCVRCINKYFETGKAVSFSLFSALLVRMWPLPLVLVMNWRRIKRAKSEDELVLDPPEQMIVEKRMNTFRILLIVGATVGIVIGIVMTVVIYRNGLPA